MVSEKDKDPRWPISMDVACDLVQKLLVQLTLNDLPPVNDNIQPSSARPLPEIHKRRKNRDSNLQEQGHVAITNLCIQILENLEGNHIKGINWIIWRGKAKIYCRIKSHANGWKINGSLIRQEMISNDSLGTDTIIMILIPIKMNKKLLNIII